MLLLMVFVLIFNLIFPFGIVVVVGVFIIGDNDILVGMSC